MKDPEHQNVVQIVGAPIACAEGVKDTWRDVASWAATRLASMYGDQVRVEYFDLFDPAIPPVPAGAQLPLVLVNGDVVNSGGKISLPRIRNRLESLGLAVHIS